MTDQNSQFFAILTAVGEAKQANASALGVPWTFAQMGVGDANLTDPIPSRAQTRLLNERRRAPLNEVKVDPANANIIIAEQIIPPDVGGWWIREIGLYDAAGDLVAVANCAPSFKPLLSQGTGKTQVVRLNLLVTSTANVQLKIDPAVVLATREYVDSSILNVLPRNKASGVYTMVEVSDRGIVQRGYKPTTLAEYGITDAMPKGAGGLMTTPDVVVGAIAALPGTQFVCVNPSTTDKPPIANGAGLHIKHPDGNFSFELVGSVEVERLHFRRVNENGDGQWNEVWHSGNFDARNTMPKYAGGLLTAPQKVVGPVAALSGTQFVAVGPETTDKPAQIDHGAGFHIKYPDSNYSIEFVGGVNTDWLGYRRVDQDGNGIWCSVWTSKNFNPDDKANKSATLDGYGITKATQADAEAGQSDSRPMTPLRVFQAVAKLVKQATEAVAGVIKIAGQDQVDIGQGDDVAVTPRKLRWNFSFMPARSGYIVFPTFLGGFVIQWQPLPVAATADVIMSFPIPYPRQAFAVFASCDYTPYSGELNYHAAALLDNTYFALRSSAGATSAGFALSVGC